MNVDNIFKNKLVYNGAEDMPLALKWAPQIKEVPGQTNTEKLIKVSNTNDDVINSTKVYIYIYIYILIYKKKTVADVFKQQNNWNSTNWQWSSKPVLIYNQC